MRTLQICLLASCLCFAANGQNQGQDANPSSSTWNVLDFGAKGDGTTDNTSAFQKALDTAGAAKGGTVLVPTGRYSFAGHLSVPRAVTLKGTFSYSPAHAGIRDKSDERPEFGSVLLPHEGAGKEDAPPFVLLQSNAVLQGVCVYYPDQVEDRDPVPYPYAVALRGNNSALLDTELLNPYNGIDASQNQRVLIRNVHGQPLNIGIFVDLIYDIGRIENIHWNPWWSINTPVYKWQTEHGRGFVFGKTDWHYVHNTFCFGYNIGYHFIETKAGATNGNFLGIGADDCFTAVMVDQSAPMGILITNGEFVSFHGPDPTMLKVGPAHNGSVRFVNCAFWGPCRRNAFIEGNGTIGFSDCTFVQWSCGEQGLPSIETTGGKLMVRGCEFKENKKQILLREGVEAAVITDNMLVGKARIQNDSDGDVCVKNNVCSKARKPVKPKK